MKLLKKITILLCFLSLIAFVSCSAEDKSGVKEKDNTEEGNFYPPFGDYKDGKIGYSTSGGEDLTITKVSKVSENTTKIKGYAARSSDGGAKRFDFDISKWKKTIKDGKDIKSEAFNIVVKPGDNLTDISIVYYYDSSTLEITFKSENSSVYLFKGTKQP
ncbi:hypothetical protein [Brachyspira aalborgi]|uniref:Uncharacterized protein n=1 Tax=Brachyspira aalborgi TaxID=29522 RepID=A0A5C8CHG9_9SPIR|nr:hypothetical protein [Brachyspira aalborgi]TXJ12437.1 hypothetical protein EPJ80_06535 [Brachyspira aalborgi]